MIFDLIKKAAPYFIHDPNLGVAQCKCDFIGCGASPSNSHKTGTLRIFFKNLLVLTLNLGFIVTSSAYANPKSASEYRELGLVYRRQQKYPEAIAVLQKAVALKPQDISSKIILGWTFHLSGQSTNAERSLIEAATINPFSVPVFNALGIVYLVRGNLNQAVFVHTWAAILKPDNEIAYYNLSLAFDRQNLWDWAIVTGDRAAQLEPDNPHPLVAKAIAYWAKGDRLSAKQAVRAAINLDGRYNSADFLNYLQEAGFSPDQIQRSKQVLAELS